MKLALVNNQGEIINSIPISDTVMTELQVATMEGHISILSIIEHSLYQGLNMATWTTPQAMRIEVDL